MVAGEGGRRGGRGPFRVSEPPNEYPNYALNAFLMVPADSRSFPPGLYSFLGDQFIH